MPFLLHCILYCLHRSAVLGDLLKKLLDYKLSLIVSLKGEKCKLALFVIVRCVIYVDLQCLA